MRATSRRQEPTASDRPPRRRRRDVIDRSRGRDRDRVAEDAEASEVAHLRCERVRSLRLERPERCRGRRAVAQDQRAVPTDVEPHRTLVGVHGRPRERHPVVADPRGLDRRLRRGCRVRGRRECHERAVLRVPVVVVERDHIERVRVVRPDTGAERPRRGVTRRSLVVGARGEQVCLDPDRARRRRPTERDRIRGQRGDPQVRGRRRRRCLRRPWRRRWFGWLTGVARIGRRRLGQRQGEHEHGDDQCQGARPTSASVHEHPPERLAAFG